MRPTSFAGHVCLLRDATATLRLLSPYADCPDTHNSTSVRHYVFGRLLRSGEPRAFQRIDDKVISSFAPGGRRLNRLGIGGGALGKYLDRPHVPRRLSPARSIFPVAFVDARV